MSYTMKMLRKSYKELTNELKDRYCDFDKVNSFYDFAYYSTNLAMDGNHLYDVLSTKEIANCIDMMSNLVEDAIMWERLRKDPKTYFLADNLEKRLDAVRETALIMNRLAEVLGDTYVEEK